MAWAGSHSQPYPKREEARENINNIVNNQIDGDKKWKRKNEESNSLDLGNDEEFPPLIKEEKIDDHQINYSFLEESREENINLSYNGKINIEKDKYKNISLSIKKEC